MTRIRAFVLRFGIALLLVTLGLMGFVVGIGAGR